MAFALTDFASLPAAALCTCLLVVGFVLRKAVHVYSSPLRLLRGPPSGNFLLGNIQSLAKVTDPNVLEQWIEDYGPNCLTRWLLFVSAIA